MRRARNERGAAAVEFALILPALLLLVLGVIEFSRLFNQQISLSNAARSAARVMAISEVQGDAVSAGIAAAPSLNPALTAGNFAFNASECEAGELISVTVSYDSDLITGFGAFSGVGPTFTLQGEAAFPCGG
jgi:Flp pilus assembly protein TadG